MSFLDESDASCISEDVFTDDEEVLAQYWDYFTDISDVATAEQVKAHTRKTGRFRTLPFLPDKEISDNVFNETGLLGIVEYSTAYYPHNWKRNFREISVNEYDKCLHHAWMSSDGYLRILSVIVPNNWQDGNSFPDIAIFGIYRNVNRIHIPEANTLLSAKESFRILKRASIDDAISEQPKRFFNCYHSYYFVVEPKVYDFDSLNATFDEGLWNLKMDKKAVSRSKWDKSILSNEDYDNAVWNPLKIPKEDAKKMDFKCLKYQRTTHPRLPLRRIIAYCADTRDERKIVSPVLVQYLFTGDYIKEDDFIRENSGGPVAKLYSQIQQESSKRTKIDTYKHLKLSGVDVDKRMVYNALRDKSKCPNVKVGKTGPSTNVDMQELFKAVSMYDSFYVHAVKEGDLKLGGQATLNFSSNLRLFLQHAPTAKQLKEYRKLVKHLDTLPDENSRIAYYNATFPKLLNNSGCVEQIACNIHVDTTYNIAGWLVTIIYGSVKSFCTKDSSKMRYILLSISWHIKKDKTVHEQHVRDLQKAIDELPADLKAKRVGCFMTDQEPALYVFKELSICTDAVHLFCFFHLRDNMTKNRKEGVSHVFGLKTNGGYSNALLCTLHKDDFDRAYRKLMKSPEVLAPQLLQFLVKHNENLWDRYSLICRLLAGMPHHYASNNILEQYNGKIKNDGCGPRSVQESVHWFVQRNRDEIDEIVKGLMGTSKEIVYKGAEDWTRLNFDEQDQLLRNLGLSRLLDTRFEKFPDGFVSSIGVNRLYQADVDAVTKYCVDPKGDGSGYHLWDKASGRTITVQIFVDKGKPLLVCPRRGCTQSQGKFCDHQLICLLKLDESQQKSIAEQYMTEEHLNEQFRAQKDPSAGKKPNQRRYLLKSKGNHPRGIRKLRKADTDDEDDSFTFDADLENQTMSPASIELKMLQLKRSALEPVNVLESSLYEGMSEADRILAAKVEEAILSYPAVLDSNTKNGAEPMENAISEDIPATAPLEASVDVSEMNETNVTQSEISDDDETFVNVEDYPIQTIDSREDESRPITRTKRPLANITNVANQSRDEQSQRSSRSGRQSVRPNYYSPEYG